MLERMADSLKKVLSPISAALTGISIAVIVLVVLAVVAEVVARRFFNSPIRGAGELNQLAFTIIVFLPLAWAALKGSHIELDLLSSKFPKRVRSGTDVVIMLMTVGILGLMSWQLLEQGMSLQHQNATTNTMGIPMYPFAYIAALGGIMVTVAFFIRFLRSLNDTIKRERR